MSSLIVEGTRLSMSSDGLSTNSMVSTATSFVFGRLTVVSWGSKVAIVVICDDSMASRRLDVVYMSRGGD
jgi:hypothetical protein